MVVIIHLYQWNLFIFGSKTHLQRSHNMGRELNPSKSLSVCCFTHNWNWLKLLQMCVVLSHWLLLVCMWQTSPLCNSFECCHAIYLTFMFPSICIVISVLCAECVINIMLKVVMIYYSKHVPGMYCHAWGAYILPDY